jgi:nitrogen fixation/metabolism regulation signal transduction histidine kinase
VTERQLPAKNVLQTRSIAFGVGFLVLLIALAALNAFRLNFLSPETTSQIVLYTVLSALAFLLFVGILILLVRNVLKLYADQRSRVMGSRLRTRMLWGAVLISVVPIAFMFAFSYLLMNRAVDRWFSQPLNTMRDDANHMALQLAQYTTANARVEAESIASALPSLAGSKSSGPELANRAEVQQVLRQHEVTLQGGFIVVFRDNVAVAALNLPKQVGDRAGVRPWLPDQTTRSGDDESDTTDGDTGDAKARALRPDERFDPADPADTALLATSDRTDEPMVSLSGNDYALGRSTIAKHGGPTASVIVGLPLPRGLAATMTRLREAADDYAKLYQARRTIRSTYMILLLMMTSLAMFASTWLALHLSKQVTKPVEALADAMESIAAGDYGHRVEASATEELGELVRSFNHMAADLESSRSQVEASTSLLSAANASLEARREELETMLETIPNGVATIDPDQRIVLINRALSEMLDPGGQRSFIGLSLAEIFPAEMMEALERLMRRCHRMGSASAELEMNGLGDQQPARTLNLLATVAVLETASNQPGREHLGYVLVLEDATELLNAQKQSAWKEVARRVAHEIKNPLTPISLSAEQIARHIERLDKTLNEAELTSPSVATIRRSAEVISSSVESMRSLVDQFAALAQFPTAQPRPVDLNTVIDNSMALFAGRMQKVRVIEKKAKDLPLVLVDPEAMKRALGNLVDNALEAMQQSLLRELRLTTCQLETGMVELTVSDTGTGLTDDMRERLFLPYFSTKQRGTGLGLAIAAKIIQEHGGTIRAEKNEPAGAKFIVELKTATVAEGEMQMADVAASPVP